MEITEMTLEDLEQMKNTLYSDFDNFWSYNVLKQELVNDKTKYIIAKEKNEVVGFAGISVIFDEATLNNIVVKKSCRGKGIGGEMLETLIDLYLDYNEINLHNEIIVFANYEKNNNVVSSLYDVLIFICS